MAQQTDSKPGSKPGSKRPSRKAPAFQLYADDFLAGTLEMSCEEVGAYIRLLCIQWSKGEVNEKNVRWVKRETDVVDDVLEAKFEPVKNGVWKNKRLADIAEVQQKRAAAGSKGGSKAAANAQQTGQQKAPPPSPSPSPSPTPNNTHTHKGAEGFEEEWQKWLDYRESIDGRKPDPIQQDAVLMDLSRRGPEKAKADIAFSLRIGAKTIRDSDNDYDKRQDRGGKPRKDWDV